MVWQRLALTAFTILALASGGLLADQPGKKPDRLEAVATKLKLTDAQKQQVKDIYADFDKKAEPLVRQLCMRHHEQWDAMVKVLTEEQRKKLPEVIKKEVAKEFQAISQKLNLTGEQQQKIGKLRAEFWQKFQGLPNQKGEHICREYRELWMDAVAAGNEMLTPDQRAKLPAIRRQDFDEHHDFTLRPDHVKEIGDQLGLSAEQRKRIEKICTAYDKKAEQPRAQLKQLCKEKSAAIEKVLTADQRAKLEQVFPFHCLATE
jgi:Spy/CpxP family protein refolding chaperone